MFFSIKSFSECAGKNGNVVFFDFNGSPEEIDGAKKIADQKCQNFYAVKSEDDANKILKKIEDTNGDISSLILSGHHKFGIFWGNNFHMTIGGMSDLFDKYPKLKDRTKNLYLWGCYTNNVDKLERWLKSFPNLNYVFGYSHKAPLSNQFTGVEYLERAMTHQDELEKIDALDKIKNFLDKMLPGTPNYHYVSAAIYGKARCENPNYKDFYYSIDQIEGGTKSNIEHFSERGQCKDAKKEYSKKYQDMLQDYWSGDKEIMSLESPGSKDPSKNPVRMDFYPWANKFGFCFNDSTFPGEAGSRISIGQVLNLIYYQTIKTNFFNYFKEDIEEALKKLPQEESDIRDLLSKGQNLTRKEIISLNKLIEKKPNKSEGLEQLNFKIKKYLVDLDDRCADVNWLEDVKSIPKQPKACTTPL